MKIHGYADEELDIEEIVPAELAEITLIALQQLRCFAPLTSNVRHEITVQNGAMHGLSRREVEAMLPFFPTAWSHFVKSVVLYQGSGTSIEVKYYPKKSIIGLFWPASNDASPSKIEAIEELLLALAVVTERGELPPRLSSSQRSHALDTISAVREKCLAMVSQMQPNPSIKRDWLKPAP